MSTPEDHQREGLAKAPSTDPITARLRETQSLVRDLVAQGVADDWAQEFRFLLRDVDHAELRELGIAWFNAGFTPQGTEAWLLTNDWSPTDARDWSDAGFQPAQATFVAQRLRERTDLVTELKLAVGAASSTNHPYPDDETSWLASGLPAAWIELSVSADVWDVETARDLYARNENDPTIEANLLLIAGLHGVDLTHHRVSRAPTAAHPRRA